MSAIQSHLCFLTPRTVNPTYPLFIFLPAMDGTGKLLRAQTLSLEKTFDVRCLAIPADDLTDWEHLSKAVIDLVTRELKKAPQRSVYLCGESFGGCLAMKVALCAPHLFQRIILINPASSFNSRPWIAWGSRLAQWLPQFLYQYSSVALLPFLAALERIPLVERQALIEAMRLVPQKTSIWRLSLLGQFQVTPAQLQALTQSVLLIASKADRLLPSLAEALRLAQLLPNAQVVTLPDSGHACLLEADIDLFEILRSANFLTDLHSTNEEVVASDH